MTLKLTTLVYNCDTCGEDTTFLVDKIKDIRKIIDYPCPSCESIRDYRR